MKVTNQCLVYFSCNEGQQFNILRLSDILAIMVSVSMTMPKNVIQIQGETTFSAFMRTLMHWQSISMDSSSGYIQRNLADQHLKRSSR